MASKSTKFTSFKVNQATALIAAKTLVEGDSGKTFYLNLAGGFTTTLPTIAEAGTGWSVNFIIMTAPTTAYIITEDATADTNVLTGGFSCSELTDAAVAAYTGAATQINFVASQAAIGDNVSIMCDGNRFYIQGHTNLQAGVTIT